MSHLYQRTIFGKGACVCGEGGGAVPTAVGPRYISSCVWFPQRQSRSRPPRSFGFIALLFNIYRQVTHTHTRGRTWLWRRHRSGRTRGNSSRICPAPGNPSRCWPAEEMPKVTTGFHYRTRFPYHFFWHRGGDVQPRTRRFTSLIIRIRIRIFSFINYELGRKTTESRQPSDLSDNGLTTGGGAVQRKRRSFTPLKKYKPWSSSPLSLYRFISLYIIFICVFPLVSGFVIYIYIFMTRLRNSSRSHSHLLLLKTWMLRY